MGPKNKYIDEKFKHLIVAGVRDDFEELLQRFTATETVRYENFVEIWREMKLPFIFAGRQSEREAREVRLCLQHEKGHIYTHTGTYIFVPDLRNKSLISVHINPFIFLLTLKNVVFLLE